MVIFIIDFSEQEKVAKLFVFCERTNLAFSASKAVLTGTITQTRDHYCNKNVAVVRP